MKVLIKVEDISSVHEVNGVANLIMENGSIQSTVSAYNDVVDYLLLHPELTWIQVEVKP